MYVVSYEKSEFGIEWIRFEEEAPYPDIVKQIPHLAFEVDDIHEAIRDRNVIIAPNEPSSGITVAFIEENGAPIEFLQFRPAESTSE